MTKLYSLVVGIALLAGATLVVLDHRGIHSSILEDGAVAMVVVLSWSTWAIINRREQLPRLKSVHAVFGSSQPIFATGLATAAACAAVVSAAEVSTGTQAQATYGVIHLSVNVETP